MTCQDITIKKSGSDFLRTNKHLKYINRNKVFFIKILHKRIKESNNFKYIFT